MNHLSTFVASLLVFLFVAEKVESAEIRFQQGPEGYTSDTAIVIDGEIVAGDFERFLSATIVAGADPGRVFISSQGGLVAEAIKIGVLIRELGFHTQVPYYMGPDEPPHCGKYDVSECTCVSACFLIFAGGVSRKGTAIRVHRSFLDHELLRSMSIAEAADYSNAITTQVERYLRHMSSPESLNEIMQNIPSNESLQLDYLFLLEHMWGPATNVEEWVIARCGNAETALENLSNTIGRAEYEEHDKTFSDRAACSRKVLKEERHRVFTSAIVKALAEIDYAYASDSLRDFRKFANDFDIQNFIGIRPAEIAPALAFLGHGSKAANEMADFLASNGEIYTDRNMIIALDEGLVYLIHALYVEVNDRPPYFGRFLNGLTSVSNGMAFVEALGRPIGGSEIHSEYGGAKTLMFRTDKADIEVTFDRELKGPRSIEINRHRYFEGSYHAKYLYPVDESKD